MMQFGEAAEGNRRRVRICRAAFQDMQHLAVPRLAARAQLRRHAMKLGYWRRGDATVADLEYELVAADLFVLKITDGFGLADGFRIAFCEEPNPEPAGTVWDLSVMTIDEPFFQSRHLKFLTVVGLWHKKDQVAGFWDVATDAA